VHNASAILIRYFVIREMSEQIPYCFEDIHLPEIASLMSPYIIDYAFQRIDSLFSVHDFLCGGKGSGMGLGGYLAYCPLLLV